MAATSTETRRIDPRELRATIDAGNELAVLDVREEGVFSRGHLFHACSVPLSSIELRIERLVPRKSTPIVLCDDDQTLVERAANVLRAFGYADLASLSGGVGAWRAAGYELFTGINVPSKAFGEFIEHRDGTPSISAEQLKQRMDAGTDMVILDSRPMTEYHAMNIPGALDCPGGELVYRVHEVVHRPTTVVVVNCAGRTRSIIGAQSLINSKLPNQVVALRNGTMGWHLAGFELERGNTRIAPAPSAGALAQARAAAKEVAAHFRVQRIGPGELERFRAESGTRSLYCLDVRDPEEFKRGTLPGFTSAPGGQLVQATDAYVATRGARLVLLDTDGVRANMTASWLNQMGLREVFVLEGADESHFVPAPAIRMAPGLRRAAKLIEVRALRELINTGGASVIDVGTSIQFRKGHIPGARWAIRARLGAALKGASLAPAVVFTSADGLLAQLAAVDATDTLGLDARALEGGTDGWRAAGFTLEPGEAGMLDMAEDVWYRPYDRKEGIENSMRDYLSWEVELIEQIKREGVRYPSFS